MYKAEPGLLAGIADGHHHPEHAGELMRKNVSK
jgi:hypothetical protein